MLGNHLVIRVLLVALLGMASIAIALGTAISSRPPKYTWSILSLMKDAIYTVAASLCGVGFYFTIIGVFELPAACLSLVLFSTLVVSAWIFQPDDPAH